MPRRNRNAGQPSNDYNDYKVRKFKDDWDHIKPRSKTELNKDRFKKRRKNNVIPEV
jgi:hypothetical protein